MRCLVVTVLVALAAGCGPDKETCEKKGGLWTVVPGEYSTGEKVCVMPTADAGKVCDITTRCEYACVSSGREDTTGHCYPWKAFLDPSGCYWTPLSGEGSVTVCY